MFIQVNKKNYNTYDRIRDAYDDINKLLNEGHSKEEVYLYLTRNSKTNEDRDLAKTLIEDAIKYKKNKFIKFFHKTPFIVLSILFVIVFNVILYYGQEFYYKNDMNQAIQIKQRLSEEEKRIHFFNKKMNLDTYSKEDKKTKSIFGQTLKYDWQLRDYFKDQYKLAINNYNSLANKYNKLAKKAYTRWLVFPKPIINSNFSKVEPYKEDNNQEL